MCPNCSRGIVRGEVCLQCAGTGFWNPESRTPEEVVVAEVAIAEEKAVVEADLQASKSIMDEEIKVEEPVVEPVEVSKAVEVAPTEEVAEVAAVEVEPESRPKGDVAAETVEEVKEEPIV